MNSLQNKIWDMEVPSFVLEGAGSKQFLHGQTSADILAIKENEIRRSCWLSPVGRFKALLEIRLISNSLYFIVLLGDPNEVFDGLQKVIFPTDKVQIKIVDKIRRLQVISMKQSWKITFSEWILPGQELPLEFDPSNIANSTMVSEWMVRQGIPENISQLSDYNPFELGFSDFVDLDKGCYLGQETLSKVKNLGKLKCQIKFFVANRFFANGESLNIRNINSQGILNIGDVIYSIKINDETSIGLALIRRKYLILNDLTYLDHIGITQLSNPIGFNDFLEV